MDCELSGSAEDLYLTLWNRLPLTAVTVTGDPEPAHIWREKSGVDLVLTVAGAMRSPAPRLCRCSPRADHPHLSYAVVIPPSMLLLGAACAL